MRTPEKLIEAVRSESGRKIIATTIEIIKNQCDFDSPVFMDKCLHALAHAIVAERDTRPTELFCNGCMGSPIEDALCKPCKRKTGNPDDGDNYRVVQQHEACPESNAEHGNDWMSGFLIEDGVPQTDKPMIHTTAGVMPKAVYDQIRVEQAAQRLSESRAASIERVLRSIMPPELYDNGGANKHMKCCNICFRDSDDGTVRELFRNGDTPGTLGDLIGTFTVAPLDAEWKWEPSKDPSTHTVPMRVESHDLENEPRIDSPHAPRDSRLHAFPPGAPPSDEMFSNERWLDIEWYRTNLSGLTPAERERVLNGCRDKEPDKSSSTFVFSLDAEKESAIQQQIDALTKRLDAADKERAAFLVMFDRASEDRDAIRSLVQRFDDQRNTLLDTIRGLTGNATKERHALASLTRDINPPQVTLTDDEKLIIGGMRKPKDQSNETT